MVIEKLNQQLCCGCAACGEICAKNAIQMVRNSEGFLYPNIDESLCIDCGMCDKVCPILNAEQLKHNDEQQVYAAVNKDNDILKESSSGGIFSVIADYVLDNGGVVCGAAFEDDLHLHHVIIDTKSELQRLRGSKYITSENDGAYKEIKQLLNQGRLVYYTGTGCQVAGLRAYLRKEYDNLVTSDLVCHGTPSPKIFSAFISKLEKEEGVKIVNYLFRDKKVNGWSCSSSSSSRDLRTGEIRHHEFNKIQNAYFNAFISGSMNREGCYKCPFAETHRTGDITLADYWGVKQFHPEIQAFKGVSAIIVNTSKGQQLLNILKTNISLTPSKMEWVAVVNANLVKTTPRPERRNTIYKELEEDSDKLINSFISNTHYVGYIKYFLKKQMRKNEKVFTWLYNLKHKITGK